MPTLSIMPILQLGRKKTTVAPTRGNNLTPPPGPHRWEQLLDEHDQCMKEVEGAFEVWLDRHQKTVRESKQWKDAHDQLTLKLTDTEMELTSTKNQLQDLQHQIGRSSNMKNQHDSESDEVKPGTNRTPPMVPRNAAAHTCKQDGFSLENHDECTSSKDSHDRQQQQQHVRELKSKMESYQVVLRWQERQTEQWRSRCHRQLNQIDDLLATVEQQKMEVEQEKEQCDILMDAVYHLIQQKEDPKKREERKKVDHPVGHHSSAHKNGHSLSYPDELFCPLTRQLFVDPVIDHEGNTYEKNAISEWLDLHETSPLTRNRLCRDQLVPNRAVKQAIAVWHKRS